MLCSQLLLVGKPRLYYFIMIKKIAGNLARKDLNKAVTDTRAADT